LVTAREIEITISVELLTYVSVTQLHSVNQQDSTSVVIIYCRGSRSTEAHYHSREHISQNNSTGCVVGFHSYEAIMMLTNL
jgi:hypothetical protein